MMNTDQPLLGYSTRGSVGFFVDESIRKNEILVMQTIGQALSSAVLRIHSSDVRSRIRRKPRSVRVERYR
jgi:hypothetical protein